MKNIVMGGIALGLVALGAATTAVAADIPAAAPAYKAPAAYVAASLWTGCYIGANVGYGLGRASSTTTGGGVTATGSENLNGVLGGGQLGCNYQMSSIVWGIEGDFQATGQRRTTT